MQAFGGLSVLLLFALREPKRETPKLTLKEKITKIDLGGTLLFISSMVCLFLGLELGDAPQNPWALATKGRCLLLGFGLLMACFILWQFRMGEKYVRPKVAVLLAHLN